MGSEKAEIRNKAKDRANLNKVLASVESGDISTIFVRSVDSFSDSRGSTLMVAKGRAIEVLNELGIKTVSVKQANKEVFDDRGAVSIFSHDAKIVDMFGKNSPSAVLGINGYAKLVDSLNTKAAMRGDKDAMLPDYGRRLQ